MPVVGNSPTTAGNTGSIPGSGEGPCAQGPLVHVPQLPSPGAPEPVLSHKRSPHSPQLEQAAYSNTDQAPPKRNSDPELQGPGAPCPFPDLQGPSRDAPWGALPVSCWTPHAVRRRPVHPVPTCSLPPPLCQSPQAVLPSASTFRNLVSVSPTPVPPPGSPMNRNRGISTGPSPALPSELISRLSR